MQKVEVHFICDLSKMSIDERKKNDFQLFDL